jgi:hypothetical protein
MTTVASLGGACIILLSEHGFIYTPIQLATCGGSMALNIMQQCLLQYLENLPDLGQRPLHFAAHSTGGIVLKKALTDAMSGATLDEVSDRVVRCCFSVAFWGVPRE